MLVPLAVLKVATAETQLKNLKTATSILVRALLFAIVIIRFGKRLNNYVFFELAGLCFFRFHRFLKA
jgi:hypothetical protein